MSHNKNIDQLCEELLEGIRRTNPELYDALVELGTLNNIAQALEEKENLVEDCGQSLEQYVDGVVSAAKEKYGTTRVVVVDEEGNVLRDTRDEDGEDDDEDWDSYDEDWDECEDEDLNSSYDEAWDSYLRVAMERGDDEPDVLSNSDWLAPVAVFQTYTPDGENTRAEFYTESAMVAYMEHYN